MEDRTKQFRVGVMVFATMIGTAFLIVMNTDVAWAPWKDQYQLQILVDQAPGVAPDTPVRRRGILIGRVDSVEDTDEGALITVNVDEGEAVKTNEVARVQTSLIGDAVIDFSPVADPEGAVEVPPESIVRGVYSPTPMDMLANLQGDLRQTIIALGEAGNEVAVLANQLNQVLGEQDVNRINQLIVSLERASDNIGNVMENVNEVVEDPVFQQELREGLRQLPSTISDIRAVMEMLARAVESADQNLVNLQGFTGPLGERGPEIVDELEASIDSLGELLGEGALFMRSLSNREGSLGRLINEREFYDQLADTVDEAQSAIRDLRVLVRDPHLNRRIRQILDNIWVLSDKIARDPARITRGIVPKNRETPLK